MPSGQFESLEDPALLESKEEISGQHKPSEKEPIFVSEQYIFCFDTLGQDCEIPPSDRHSLSELVFYFRDCYEDNQKQLLKQIIDHQIGFQEQYVLHEVLEQMVNEEYKY